jgi:hypothetical protein
MTLDNLRFELRVVNKETGEVIVSDFTYLTPIDQFGNSESVDIHVGAALRCVRDDLMKERA